MGNSSPLPDKTGRREPGEQNRRSTGMGNRTAGNETKAQRPVLVWVGDSALSPRFGLMLV